MKKKSPPYAIIGAAVLGLIIAFLVYRYLQNAELDKEAGIAAERQRAQAAIDAANAKPTTTVVPTNTNMRPVLYATQPIEAGVKINPAFYEKKLTPNELLPDAYTDQSDIVGWYAIRKIEKGDPLRPNNIGKSLPYLSQRISPGMRAISIPIFSGGDVNQTGGFIVDGDRVDLLFTLGRTYTQTIMQNVNVLFVPGPPVKTEKTDGVNPVASAGTVSVTFEVTPEQAQALVYLTSSAQGRFSMILRARKDDGETKLKSFDVRDYDLDNLSKVQRTVDKSVQRVAELAQEIQAKENAAQGKTNETPNPTPPSP